MNRFVDSLIYHFIGMAASQGAPCLHADQEVLEGLAQRLGGRPPAGPTDAGVGQLDGRPDHHADRRGERQPAEAPPHPLGAEHGHGEDRATLPQDDVGEAGVDGGEPARSPAALREQAEHVATGDHRGGLAQRLPVGAASAHRELADPPQDGPERPEEQLRLAHEEHRPLDRAGEQDRVDVAAVVACQDGWTGVGEVLGTLDPDTEACPHQWFHHDLCRAIATIRARRGHRSVPALAEAISSRISSTMSATSRPVVSMTRASGAALVGDEARPLSARSRRASAPADSPPARRRARSAASAVRKTFTSACGHTTAPITRPPATTPPRLMTARWRATSCSRTAGTAETADTDLFTSGERSSSPVAEPSSRTRTAPERPGASSSARSAVLAATATASASSGGTPCRSSARVSAR